MIFLFFLIWVSKKCFFIKENRMLQVRIEQENTKHLRRVHGPQLRHKHRTDVAAGHLLRVFRHYHVTGRCGCRRSVRLLVGRKRGPACWYETCQGVYLFWLYILMIFEWWKNVYPLRLIYILYKTKKIAVFSKVENKHHYDFENFFLTH